MIKIDKNLINKKDSDNDGLSDFDEINKYHTDPNNPDTDGDGIDDGTEIKLGLNPLMKDFFIPTSANNYRPKALEPKRLFFYGASALIVKVIIVLTVVSMPLLAFFNPDYVAQESKKIIELTNNIRIEKNIPILVENFKLDQSAMWKVEDMLVKQYFAHTSPSDVKLSNWLKKSNYDYRFAGENLAMGFSDADEVMDAWVKSETHYKNLIDPDFKEIGVAISSGVYDGYETTFIAQHFGTKQEVVNNNEVDSSKKPINKGQNSNNKKASTTKVLSYKEVSQEDQKVKDVTGVIVVNSAIEEVIAPYIVNSGNTKIFSKTNSSKETVVYAEVYLSENTKDASIYFKDQILNLQRDDVDKTKWTGHMVVDGDIFKPIISAQLVANGVGGKKFTTEMDWDDIVSSDASVIDKYALSKTNKNSYINDLFSASNIYYKIIALLAIILLVLNIFIKIKRQHADIIIFSIFFITFILFLLVF